MHEVKDVFMHAFDFEILFLADFVNLIDEGSEFDGQVIEIDDHVHCEELIDDGLVDVLDVDFVFCAFSCDSGSNTVCIFAND